jgi:quercetin dioxygenase-like cupin family protein
MQVMSIEQASHAPGPWPDGRQPVVLWNDFLRSFYWVWEPGMECAYHYHKDAVEVFCFLEGSCEITVAGETRIVHAGQAVYAGPGVPHKLKVVGDKPMKMFLVVTPNHAPSGTIVEPDGGERDTSRRPPGPDEIWIGRGDTMPGLRGAPK